MKLEFQKKPLNFFSTMDKFSVDKVIEKKPAKIQPQMISLYSNSTTSKDGMP
jgi:hypothetical protein